VRCSLILLMAAGLPLLTKPPAPANQRREANRPTEQALVEINARALYLPELPDSTSEAHKHFRETGPLMVQLLEDLELDIQALYASPEIQTPLPPSMPVPPGKAEEVQFLASLLADPTFQELDRHVQEKWTEWQITLVDSGLGSFTKLPVVVAPKPTPSTPDPPEAAQKARRQEALMAHITQLQIAEGLMGLPPNTLRMRELGYTMAASQASSMIQGGMAAAESNGNRGASTSEAEAHAFKVGAFVAQIGIANRRAPSLAQAWAPLAKHLNQCALRLLDFKSQKLPEDATELRKLRVHAEAAFLERFRYSLWFSQVVYSQMVFSPVPKPLKNLMPNTRAI